jgi:hypothetical protein
MTFPSTKLNHKYIKLQIFLESANIRTGYTKEFAAKLDVPII